jgi:hypothetical protein
MSPFFCVITGLILAAVVLTICGLLATRSLRESEPEPERVSDFFEPVQYPTMDQLEARRMAREYSKQTTVEY